MAEEPVKYEDLPAEHKKKYDDLKAIFEADLIGSFEKTRSHGIKFKGFQPEGALEGLDLSLPSDERTRALRQEINYAVAHSLHRHSESLVNTLERVALHATTAVRYAAPQQQGSPAYVVYKVGGDPGDYQFMYEPPKEIPHGYVCTYVPDCNNWMSQVTAGGTATVGRVAGTGVVAGAGNSSGADAEKQAWLTKYATGTSHERSTSAAPTVDEITAIMRDQFGILPKKRMIGYSKPYPNEYDLIPLPPKYRLPDFTKFSGSEGTSSIEHVSRYLAQLGMVSASDELRVRFFSQSLTGPAFGWYTSLPPDSVRTWKQLEEQFHIQYHSEATEAGIADLTQVRQRRGETVSEYIQRFRTVRNRCYSVRLSEKEAVELAIAGLSAPLKDVTFQADYNSLAHMVQKLTSYEQRHPELYQDKFKRVALIEMEEDEDSVGDQEVAVAEWTRGAKPVSCKWVKQPGPAKGFDFDLSKTEQIFDLLLKEKQLKLPEGHKIPTVQEMNGRPYCKWHHTFTHATNDCKVLRGQIQMAIEQGRLLFGQFAMRVDTNPFPDVNMVDLSHCIREPGFSFDINMAGLADRHSKDKPESSHSRGKDKEEADPRDRPQHDDRRYLTEEEVRSVRYQRPLSAHLLNKYEQQYDRRRRYDVDDDRYRRSDADDRKYRRYEGYERHARGRSREQEDMDRHWNCPFFKHCWDSGMSRLPTIENCPECKQKRKGTNEVSVFKRLGPLPPQNKRAESSQDEDFEESEEEDSRGAVPVHVEESTARSGRENSANIGDRGTATEESVAPKQTKADAEASADTNMVFILPSEFCAPRDEEVSVAQFDCGPRPVIFEKPREKSYRHLKALYLKGYINGQPISKMLVDTGAAVNIMPYSMLRRLGRSNEDLIKTNVTLSDFNGQASEAKGVLNVDLTVGRKTIPTSFFIVDSKSTYAVLLGRDWIHANCCIPSTMHQCIIQWDGDEVEVVHADDSIEISLAAMNIWEANDQEPLSGINLDGCERIEASKNGSLHSHDDCTLDLKAYDVMTGRSFNCSIIGTSYLRAIATLVITVVTAVGATPRLARRCRAAGRALVVLAFSLASLPLSGREVARPGESLAGGSSEEVSSSSSSLLRLLGGGEVVPERRSSSLSSFDSPSARNGERLFGQYSRNWTKSTPKILFFPGGSRTPKESRRRARGPPHTWAAGYTLAAPAWCGATLSPLPRRLFAYISPFDLKTRYQLTKLQKDSRGAAAIAKLQFGTEVSVPAPRDGEVPPEAISIDATASIMLRE
ncbi:hypothetical protein QYE76_044086 [Lolium multiflorum]|uniref:Peptidase A2 domain-containing protein n=1 Tax=Lolium multiflorum TaxID=4521 RepID=A0AAD8WYS6_LOLMU|nr:hypothetical protein QYE76_044086 [Lolium multiflorum]